MAVEVNLDVPVRPLPMKFPRPARRREGKFLTALLYGDTHHGFHCPKTLAVVQAIGEDLQPDVLVDMGDGVDAGHLSDKFRQNPERTTGLQEEINAKRLQLAAYRLAMPNARFIYLEGNHEERLKRTLWNSEGPAKALLELDISKKNLTWPGLLDLASLHIEFYPYAEQTDKVLLPKFILKHGTRVNQKSGYTAMNEMQRYGRSGASGHTHRLGAVWKGDHDGGQHVWVETGCCANLRPEYTQDPDWQNGCVILTFDKDSGAVQVEPIEIRDGHTTWRKKHYHA